MDVSYLVDGYNLLFALGLFERRDGTHALESARARLLDQLREVLASGGHEITVVFDAAKARTRARTEQDLDGIRVIYAPRGDIADDVIEQRVATCTNPRSLVVISNDRRVQEAARRKGVAAWTSDDFLERQEEGEPRRPVKQPRPERAAPSRADVQHWLAEFGDLADDPDFREVFERFVFEDLPEHPS
jgi:predicted RNA-binding protein with PIN domain